MRYLTNNEAWDEVTKEFTLNQNEELRFVRVYLVKTI